MSENQKKIWITGASSGIGKALAEKFAAEGWMVAVSARRKEILDEMSKHENIFSYPLDVTNQDQIKTSFGKIIEDFNGLDLCVFQLANNRLPPYDINNLTIITINIKLNIDIFINPSIFLNKLIN